MKHEPHGYDELARLIYCGDKRAISAFRKRLSEDSDQDAFDALASDARYTLHIDWSSPDYVSVVSDIRKLKPCSVLAVNWHQLKKLSLWLDEQERKAGEYWSISFVKVVASALGCHGLEVLLIRDSSDPDWAAMTLFPCESTRSMKKLFDRSFSKLDATWCLASAAEWDCPADVRNEIRQRMAVIGNA